MRQISRLQLSIILCALFFSSTGHAEEINLKRGQIHLNEVNGVFATALDGDYTIVITADYDSRSMSAVVADSSTGASFCLLGPCKNK